MEAKKMVAVCRYKANTNTKEMTAICYNSFPRKQDFEAFLRRNGYVVYCILTTDQIEYYCNGSEESEADFARLCDRIDAKNKYASEYLITTVCVKDAVWLTCYEASAHFERITDMITDATTCDEIGAANDEVERIFGDEFGFYSGMISELFSYAGRKQEQITDMRHAVETEKEQNMANSIMDAIIGAKSYNDVCDAIQRASNSDAVGLEMYNDLYELYKIRLQELDRDSYQVYARTIRNATDADTVDRAIDEATEDGRVSLEIHSKLCDLAFMQYDKLRETRKEVV